MTKFREPITFNRALTTVAALIGWDRCAAICGRSERTVRYWSEPDTDTEISLIDARRLDQAYLAAGGEYPPFHRTFALQLGLEGREPAGSPAITAAAATIAKEGGEAIAAMLDAAANANCEAARRKAKREVREAVEAMGIGLDTLGDGE